MQYDLALNKKGKIAKMKIILLLKTNFNVTESENTCTQFSNAQIST